MINNSSPFVFFGNHEQIAEFVNGQNSSDDELHGLFVPLDGSVPSGKQFS